MNNFLEFIDKDISTKKTLIQSLPIRTKTNIKKFNETINSYENRYEEYRNYVRNYLLAKSRSFEFSDSLVEKKREINDKVIILEHVKFLLNPSNSYYEKMGFDILIYQLSNYYVFNFKSLNEIINSFLDKFELVGIKLSKNDFNYTCYVNEYMASFLDVRCSSDKNYGKMSEIFEKIYWVNPDIIRHIELNFRKLIRIHSKKFISYITKLQNEAMLVNNISSYDDCLLKLKELHTELKNISKECILDIVMKSKNNEFNIEHYFENNKVRVNAYESLISKNVDLKNDIQMKSIYENLEKFKDNINEYNNYLEFLPIFNSFKDEFNSLVDNDIKEYKEVDKILDLIEDKERELDRINKKIFGGKFLFFAQRNENSIKSLKIESVAKTKELYELYQKYDEKYFYSKVLSILNKNITVSDVLHLYYSFDYFKKLVIQKVYNTNSYDDIIKYSSNFDMYAMDSTNVIIAGIPIFDEVNIPRIIANKYRLANINVTEDELQLENLKNILNKINLILRVKMINDSPLSIEKVWFMTWVDKTVARESDAN